MLTLSTQMQKSIVSRRGKNENTCQMSKMKNARGKCAKLLFFTVKYANVRRPYTVAVLLVAWATENVFP